MAKMQCICGNIMFLTNDEPYEFQMIRTSDMFKINEMLDEKTINSDNYIDFMLDSGYNVCICNKCHRLWVQKLISGKHTYTPYRLESDCE